MTDQQQTNGYYDEVAEYYHLFYRDWDATMQREGSALRRSFRDLPIVKVLDASCGTGTQAIAMAQGDYEVTAADPSQAMLLKAQDNARRHRVAEDITFLRADFLTLPDALVGPYDAIVTKGNSLPHLIEDTDLAQALRNFHGLLTVGGILLIGMRDFDFMLEDRPRFVPRQLHTDDPDSDVILFDVWDWEDGPPATVVFNTFIVTGKGDAYSVHKTAVRYRALRRAELETLLTEAGFTDIKFEVEVWELVVTARRA